MHTISTPAAASERSTDSETPSLGSAVITAAGRIVMLELRIAELDDENRMLREDKDMVGGFANTNAEHVARRNRQIRELEDQLRAVGELSARQGEKLMRIDELARIINESETAIGVGQAAYKEATDRVRQLIGTVDEVDATEAAAHIAVETTAAYKRRNAAFVGLLKLAGVLILPESLTRCQR